MKCISFLKVNVPTNDMYEVILTELGVMTMKDGEYTRSHPFTEHAKEYLDVRSGKARLHDLVAPMAEDISDVETNDEGLLSILNRNSVVAKMMNDDRLNEIQDSKISLLVTAGFVSNEHDALGKLRSFALDLSSSRVAQISGTLDLHIIQAINSLDETDRISNSMFGRLREWYGLHFPELENLVDSMAGYCNVVLAGRRNGLDMDAFVKMGFPESKADMLSLVAKTSRGGEITDEDLECTQAMARDTLSLYKTRQSLDEHVESQMKRAAPNLTIITGAGLGARLLARAGSLNKLASKAASTIQVLGAEKALFHSLKTGSRPPKHGLLFQHPLVHGAPRWQRGKIARAVASKTVIAARMDLHNPVLNETLLERLNVRVIEIADKYKEAPVKPQQDLPTRKTKIGRQRDFRSSKGDHSRVPKHDKTRRRSKNVKRKRRFDR